MREEEREGKWREILADSGADYDLHEEIGLSRLERLIANPSSPGNVVPVREIADEPVSQTYIGSSANPGYEGAFTMRQATRSKQKPE